MRPGSIIEALFETAGIGSLCIAIPFVVVWVMAKLGGRNEGDCWSLPFGDVVRIPEGMARDTGRAGERAITAARAVTVAHNPFASDPNEMGL